ncbi:MULTISPECIES: hypothetical protein [Alteribacter]|nr:MULTISPECIES: hypothetical protein [Alteribacter]MBM7096005.1 hypothetical protein [Alteribacter salitolerans]
MNPVHSRVLRAFQLTYDFYKHLPESSLQRKIADVPSNTIGEQAYCIVGARESYLQAMRNGAWAGFSCSLEEPEVKKAVLAKLEETKNNIHTFLQETIEDPSTLNFTLDLLEHEIQHHGQLIRFGYANTLSFPQTWHERYTV